MPHYSTLSMKHVPPIPAPVRVNEEHNLKRAPNFPHLCCVESPQEAFRCTPCTSIATETAVLLKD